MRGVSEVCGRLAVALSLANPQKMLSSENSKRRLTSRFPFSQGQWCWKTSSSTRVNAGTRSYSFMTWHFPLELSRPRNAFDSMRMTAPQWWQLGMIRVNWTWTEARSFTRRASRPFCLVDDRCWRKAADLQSSWHDTTAMVGWSQSIANFNAVPPYPNNRSSRAAKNASTLAGATSSSVAGDHFGFLSLSMIAARMPS